MAKNSISTKDAACRLIAFVVVVASFLLVGAICLAETLRMFADGRNDQAVVLAISYFVMLIGTGDSAKRVAGMLSAALPGSTEE